MQRTITVCNVCQDVAKSTRPYTLGQGNRSASVDLCEVDAKGIEALLPAAVVRKRTTKKAVAKKVTSRRVVSPEEIEAAKQQS